MYARGLFDTAGATPANYIAKWNGSSWAALGSGMNSSVLALAVSGSDLYAGGEFTMAGGSNALYVAKWNGSGWSALGSGLNDRVRALVVSGSDLYAGSDNRIAKWNGSSWTTLGFGTGGGGPYGIYVGALAVSGSDLYTGGEFMIVGGKVSAYIARAYLLTLPALSVRRSGTDVKVSWPSVDTDGFDLERADVLASPATWVTNSASVTDDGTNKSVSLPPTNSAQLFRLRRP